jgi:protein involved in polysaccharide export with SLBB domain
MALIHSQQQLTERLPVRRALSLLVPVLSAVVMAACANSGPPATGAVAVPATASVADSVYKLDTGDKLRVIVFGEMDLGGEYEVDGSGYVSLPLIGQLKAGGLAVGEFETTMKAALEDGYLRNARVSVEVINYRPFYILGQVNKPGEYPYVNGMSVLNAVAVAGGYTYRANESTVYIRRRGAAEETLARSDQTTRVQPGDIITVRERFF